jgi:methyl-accepting chemotaxis protein
MERPPIPSGREFRKRFTATAVVPGTIGALLLAAYIAAVVDLGRDGWVQMGWLVGLSTIAITMFAQWMQRIADADIVHALDRLAAGACSREELARAYAASRRLPQHAMRTQAVSYVTSAVLSPVWMKLAIPDTTTFTLLVLMLAPLIGGTAVIPFSTWAIQRFVSPTRDWFAQQLSSEERATDGQPSSLVRKLALPVATASAATVVFLALLGYSVSTEMIEAQDLRFKLSFVEGAATGVKASAATTRHLATNARQRGVASALGVMSLADPAPVAASLGLTPREIAWIQAGDGERSTSAGLESRSSFAWARVDDDRVLVAASPLAEIVGDVTPALWVIGFVLAGLIAVSVLVAQLVAQETRSVADRLRRQAQRVGEGDFTARDTIESDDELGAVAHAFAKMIDALGGTVGRVVATATRIEGAAAELAKIGNTVREVTAAQVEGIERANGSVVVVNRQASEITSSAQELIGGVEEASSSVLELGAASEQLNQTAIALNTQVEAVGTSIDQMVRSVAHAGEAAEALNAAVVDTNSSVAEMSRSMQSVDAHAWETARLSTRMIELADGGRDRVQETMRGMEVIRDATDAANRTISGLADRMQEIGAIVDVIDEIADETNLLALNAAIIAAQAGDQGRAFSVVADEIKELADRVLSNTKEIGGVIRSVQSESATAADAIRSGAERVQSGVDLSAQAGVALEEITAAARHSGERIQEIVQAMREQTRAAAHVEQLSHGVGERVEQIRVSMREQSRGNEVVMRGSHVMRDVAQQTQRTTEEQARGALRIRDSIESVREAVDRIHASLQQQNQSCQAAANSLSEVFERTRMNDEVTDALAAAARTLQQQAEALRDDVRKFRLA